MAEQRLQNAHPHGSQATEPGLEPVRLELLGEAGDYSKEELQALLQAELITGRPANRDQTSLSRLRRPALLLLIGGGLFWAVVFLVVHLFL